MASKRVNQIVPDKAALKPMSKRRKPGHGDGGILSDKIRKVVKEANTNK